MFSQCHSAGETEHSVRVRLRHTRGVQRKGLGQTVSERQWVLMPRVAADSALVEPLPWRGIPVLSLRKSQSCKNPGYAHLRGNIEGVVIN